ncbi:hypothetical protein AZH51_13795 [Branchiibius sp. NY16-3462-2]|nr:oligosaccharide flippase family protein [Branchiibius sp. NY16-3462-2]KYH44967.1 hypothetical protein AZH51_13795 [Branchiibius sp. NY16-3462-2]
MVAAASSIAPIVGLVASPLLSQNLGVDGRGALAAALAPSLMLIEVVHLGMPDAVAYFSAKHPSFRRRAVVLAALMSLPVVVLGVVVVMLTSPFLASGYEGLTTLINLAALSVLPIVMIGFLRGAAIGAQRWTMTASERVLNPVLRMVGLVACAVAGVLDLRNALLVMITAPLLAGLLYLPLLRAPAREAGATLDAPSARMLLSFGTRSWIGGIATMLMARLPELLIAPLSDFEQLGLFVVCLTISGVPFVVVSAIAQVVFGSNAAERNDDRLLGTSSVSFVMAVAISLVLAITVPWWIEPIFGRGFQAAVVPTWIGLLSSVVLVPAMIAGSGIMAAGRPGRRSIALLLALACYTVLLLVMVPSTGATGAACADLVGNLVVGGYCIRVCQRDLGMSPWRFFIPRRHDLLRLRDAATTLVTRRRSA